MSGYTPVFRSVFQGSLCGRYPDLPVWLVLLAMADRNGQIDAHPAYISGVSGIPVHDVVASIDRFCAPDPDSRTPDHEGRRLEPIPGRGFGWTILNHSTYREKARKAAYDADRTASGRDAERKRAERAAAAEKAAGTVDHPETPPDVPTCPDASRESRSIPLSDSDSDSDSKKISVDTSSEPLPMLDARKRSRRHRGRRCPEDWNPTPEQEESIRAECPDIDLLAETRKFRDHEFARARSDWPATWRNWMRESQRRAAQANRPRPSRYEQLMGPADTSGEPNPFLLGLHR